MLRVRLGSVVGLEFDWVLGTTLALLDRLILGKYVGINLVLLKCSTDRTKDDKFDDLLLGYWLLFLDSLKIGNNGCDKLGFTNGIYLAQNLDT